MHNRRVFDERDPALKHMPHLEMRACRKVGKYVGIYGQGRSDHSDLARWLQNRKQGFPSSLSDLAFDRLLRSLSDPSPTNS
ncbi:MAG: hypothetical protein HY525_14385 [Betaproteobacteria bacterium]|nr:hypothetical protein [Betaproteobacteria bacterium]